MPKPFKYKLSVIIVNYNVEYFLEQCLNSVFKAVQNIKTQVFVVDNNSIDGSVEMVKRKFPEVFLIENKENKGFSKANNQGMLASDAEFVLLLNPDTVVEEDTFLKCIDFMDQHPNAGGLGVRMIDGKGEFLPESKRGLPTPSVAFYKIFGLSRLFPKSKKIGRYHLGYLSEFDTNKVEILSGAFMFMRAEALEKVGLLDEAFFMYGEDIDLSYRIIKGGYDNYYFPQTRIIHYKGESTKKSSVNYVFVFYRAMVIFAQKHFSQKHAKLFSFMINLAIYFRASLALLMRFVSRAILPVFDFAIIFIGLYALTDQWKQSNIEFPQSLLNIAIPSYTLIWMLSVFFQSGYDQPIRLLRYIRASFFGTILILVIYALLPKEFQFSRLYILIGAGWVSFYYLLSRVFLHFAMGERFSLQRSKSKKFAIVGKKDEFERVRDLLKQTYMHSDSMVHVTVEDQKHEGAVGTINQLDQIAHILGVNEIVFCARDTAAGTIMHWMTAIDSEKVDFKIAQPDSFSLIGSNSIETAGDLYVMNINAIAKKENIRSKRIFDITVTLLMLVLSPMLIFCFREKKKYIENLFSILVGKTSFVGYRIEDKENLQHLPFLKSGVLNPSDAVSFWDDKLADKLNLLYARDYQVQKDFKILLRAWKKLDR